MATDESQFSELPHLAVRNSQPLIAIVKTDSEGNPITYYVDEETADAATSATDIEAALALGGAWSDLCWEDVEAGLDRIRHESVPTPPIKP